MDHQSRLTLHPQPRKVDRLEGNSSLSSVFKVVFQDAESERAAFHYASQVEGRSTEHSVKSEEAESSDAGQFIRLYLERAANLAAVKANSSAHEMIAASKFQDTSLSVTPVCIALLPELHEQGYVLEWDGKGLFIGVGAAEGLHYAMITLEQLMLRQGLIWDHFHLEDEPDFPVRGVMLDIGRNKIPKLTTLYELIDHLSKLKFNHLQLYIEGFAFDYTLYRELFPEATPISAAEFRELDAYAKTRFIDLVPNQNCLGHMAPWLMKPELAHLAEHPGGQPTPHAFKLPPTTLNPMDDKSIELVQTMFDELLPLFSSSFANINLDEPFGLGKGQSKEQADEIGIGKLYFNYAEKVIDIVRSHGKRTLMWGDIATKHPEIIPMLPKDVTVLHWNYDSHTSFEVYSRLLAENAVPFYVCPGTSSWSSITGRTDNMLVNIADAAKYGKIYGAEGYIVTDWGDTGHWQPLVLSYPAYALAAGASWNADDCAEDAKGAARYVSECILKDNSGVIGELLLELGRYYLLEQSTLENMTYTSYLLHRGLSTREKLESETAFLVKLLVEIGGRGIPFQLDYHYNEMQIWLVERVAELSRVSLDVADSEVIIAELTNALRLIKHGSGLHRYIFKIDLPDAASEIAWITKLKDDLAVIIEEFNRLWLLRNRNAGLSTSNANLYKLQAQYEERLRELEDEL